jgi:HipA-like C-terminal domain
LQAGATLHLMSYEVVSIPISAREDTEQLGSKPKFWVSLGDGRWLFKEARPLTGEDWAEKVAAELARSMGIRAAQVELAQYGELRGCISRSFVQAEDGQELVHGNEILAGHVTGYDRNKTFRQSDHTLDNVISAVRHLIEDEAASAGLLTELASYLVLDALIANTDRHHENWGLLVKAVPAKLSWLVAVAPSYDHASSLGRELRDERRQALLRSGAIAAYIRRGRGGIFRDSAQSRGENPLLLLQHACQAYPAYFRPALDRVSALSVSKIRELIDLVPECRASGAAKEFAYQMVVEARSSLIQIAR